MLDQPLLRSSYIARLLLVRHFCLNLRPTEAGSVLIGHCCIKEKKVCEVCAALNGVNKDLIGCDSVEAPHFLEEVGYHLVERF